MTCGIYMIKNKKTGQMYIGQSVNIEKRYMNHRTDGKRRANSYIDNAIFKYGPEMFDLKIIEVLDNDEKILNDRERYWVSYYNTFEDRNHYNLTPGGDFNPMKVPEIAEKISKAMSGRNNLNYGKHLSRETKDKISASLKGKGKVTKNNTTGYYRVSMVKCDRYKQGYRFCYSYYDENYKRKSICRTKIDILQKVIENRGLVWKKLEDFECQF